MIVLVSLVACEDQPTSAARGPAAAAPSTPRPDPGRPQRTAIASLPNVAHVPSGNVQDGVVMDRLDARLTPHATNGELNDLLTAEQAVVAAAERGIPAITIGFPPAKDRAELDARIARFKAARIFDDVRFAKQPAPE